MPLTARGEHPDSGAPPLSARGTRPLSSWGSKFDPESADTATLLQKLREYKPQIYVPPERGTKKELHQLLENMKEMALQAEFGLHSAEDSMSKVRRWVGNTWRETNRLNAKETGLLLAAMYYQVAEQPEMVARLVDLWIQLLEQSHSNRANVFLDGHRLVLLPFNTVFVASDAMQLAIGHYIRSDPETEGGTRRGGLALDQLEKLLKHCMGSADSSMLSKLKQHIFHMAALSQPMSNPSLVVSVASMDVRAPLAQRAPAALPRLLLRNPDPCPPPSPPLSPSP